MFYVVVLYKYTSLIAYITDGNLEITVEDKTSVFALVPAFINDKVEMANARKRVKLITFYFVAFYIKS